LKRLAKCERVTRRIAGHLRLTGRRQRQETREYGHNACAIQHRFSTVNSDNEHRA
jgi:hypothetical protein